MCGVGSYLLSSRIYPTLPCLNTLTVGSDVSWVLILPCLGVGGGGSDISGVLILPCLVPPYLRYLTLFEHLDGGVGCQLGAYFTLSGPAVYTLLYRVLPCFSAVPRLAVLLYLIVSCCSVPCLVFLFCLALSFCLAVFVFLSCLVLSFCFAVLSVLPCLVFCLSKVKQKNETRPDRKTRDGKTKSMAKQKDKPGKTGIEDKARRKDKHGKTRQDRKHGKTVFLLLSLIHISEPTRPP